MGTPAYAATTGSEDELRTEYERRVRFLRRVGLFYDSSPALLAQIAAVLQPLAVAAGTVVCHEGEPGEQFFLINDGTLVVTVQAGNQPKELARLGAGEFFGEIALLEGGRRTATVQAETEAQLWTLSAPNFAALLEHEPAVAEVVKRAAQLRETRRVGTIFEVVDRNLAALRQGKQRLTIGRDLDNDLVFPSRLVSRHHALLELAGDTYRLRDLGSNNGTYVNGAEVKDVVLNDGDEVWVGDERFIFDRREIKQPVEPRGIRVDVEGLTKVVRGGKQLLHDISLSILPGEFIAIVGGSGAGKTTLMDAISGVRPATSGRVRYNGRDYYRNLALFRNVLGYVPQDDIIHTTLPVRDTLHFAARLRLPPDTSKADLDAAVDQAINELGLTAQAKTVVGSLSGGQRKRASIGVELLTRPRIFFLDEPTSGLDPATDAQMMRLMRQMANDGSTVILTTHATKNVILCDKIVFLARGGHLAFVGTPQRALQYFDAETFDEIYDLLANEMPPEEWGERFRASADYRRVLADQPRHGAAEGTPAPPQSLSMSGRSGGPLRQMRQLGVLAARSFRIFTQSPPTIMPLLMQPVIISVLVLVLFRSGAFDLDVANPASSVSILFFLAFATFLFGVFDGLQEIVKESAIFQRERMVNLAILPYVLSKVLVLAPILIFNEIVMVAVLRVAGRLPAADWSVYGKLMVTLLLAAFASLTLGLFASAALKTADQASQIMPALIMPQALFAGAILAVPSMNIVGQAISYLMITRWSFEALGRIVDLNALFQNGTSPIAKATGLQFGDSFSREIVQNWAILGVFGAVFFALTCIVLWAKSARR